MKVMTSLPVIDCERCGHRWIPRKLPIKICPKCKSIYWDTPKGRKGSKK